MNEKGSMTAPQIIADTSIEDVMHMVAMSSIIQNVAQSFKFKDTPFSGDDRRNKIFASQLCEKFGVVPFKDGVPVNLLEGMTYAITLVQGNGIPADKLGCHVDQFNCRVWNILFTVYSEQEDTFGTRYRIAIIGFARACALL